MADQIINARVVPEYLRRAQPIARAVSIPGAADLPLAIPGPDNAASAPVFNTQYYGDMSATFINFAGAGQVLALPRPKNTRVSLLIQNLTGGALAYGFDAPNIAIGAGVQIDLNGSRNFSGFIPQNDLFVAVAAAGLVVIEYANSDITRT